MNSATEAATLLTSTPGRSTVTCLSLSISLYSLTPCTLPSRFMTDIFCTLPDLPAGIIYTMPSGKQGGVAADGGGNLFS